MSTHASLSTPRLRRGLVAYYAAAAAGTDEGRSTITSRAGTLTRMRLLPRSTAARGPRRDRDAGTPRAGLDRMQITSVDGGRCPLPRGSGAGTAAGTTFRRLLGQDRPSPPPAPSGLPPNFP
ncbi:hypothetical protein GCM10009550_04030 [Actinocorallia libanotica]|uniref:Uncharacterized protein n=1 Tax=Actinocorallia libanotica TaxID=46162 RepID=A0ABN1Q3T7_9ACTN